MSDTNEQAEVGEPNKCCETCGFYWEQLGTCGNSATPHIDFCDGISDPAEFHCNHWQQKEE